MYLAVHEPAIPSEMSTAADDPLMGPVMYAVFAVLGVFLLICLCKIGEIFADASREKKHAVSPPPAAQLVLPYELMREIT